jgi:hypothetical protein
MTGSVKNLDVDVAVENVVVSFISVPAATSSMTPTLKEITRQRKFNSIVGQNSLTKKYYRGALVIVYMTNS